MVKIKATVNSFGEIIDVMDEAINKAKSKGDKKFVIKLEYILEPEQPKLKHKKIVPVKSEIAAPSFMGGLTA